MQKRDKFGRFLKGKVNKTVKHCRVKKVKKEAKKKPKINFWTGEEMGEMKAPTSKKVTVYVKKKEHLRPKLGDLTLFDLQDMIQAEVAFQMKANW